MLEKYLYLDSRKGDDFSQLLENIIVMQRQLEHLSRKERVDDLARKHQEDKVVYSELLELCQELKWEVSKMNGASQARSCINLCLLLLCSRETLGEWKNILRSESSETSVVKNRRIKIWYVLTRMALWFCWKILIGPDLLMGPIVQVSLHWNFSTYFSKLYYS